MNNDNTRGITLGGECDGVRLGTGPCTRNSRVSRRCDCAGKRGCVEHGLGQDLGAVRRSLGKDKSRAFAAVQSRGLGDVAGDEQRLVNLDHDRLDVNNGRDVGARIRHTTSMRVSVAVAMAMTASGNSRHQSRSSGKEAVSNHGE